MTIFLTSSY